MPCTSPAASQPRWVLGSHGERLHPAPSFQPHVPCSLFKLKDLFAGDLNNKFLYVQREKSLARDMGTSGFGAPWPQAAFVSSPRCAISLVTQ